MSKKTTIIVIAVLVLAILIGIGIGITFWKNANSGVKEIVRYNLTIDEMYSNIKDSKRILKMKITIESIDPKTIEKLTEKSFLVRDEVIKIARNKTDDDLEGAEGQTNLKEEIKTNLITLFEDETITNVYFNEFVIQ